MWWPTMEVDVRNFIKLCETCAINKLIPHKGQMQIPPNGSRPWQVACVDVVDLETTSSGNRKAVVFADRFGRGIRCYPAPNDIDSEMFLNTVAFGLIPDVGCPLLMISDRGSILISELCLEFYHHYGGIEPRHCDAHMHTGVGLCERFNSTLRQMARAAYFDTKCEWDLFLPLLVLFYNATVDDVTGYSPYYIEHGREPRLPWHPYEEMEEGNVSEFVNKHLLGLYLAYEASQSKVAAGERKRKEHHDKAYQTNVSFEKGSRVLILQAGRRSKMEMPYVGPYRVLEGPDARDRYKLADIHGRRFNEFHVSRLKHWPLEGDLEDGYFEVDHIVDIVHDERKNEKLYKVRWKGYSKKHDSLVSWEDLNEEGRVEALAFERSRLKGQAAGSEAPRDDAADRGETASGQGTQQAEANAKAKDQGKKTKEVTKVTEKTAHGTRTTGGSGSEAADATTQNDTSAQQRDAREQRAQARAARYDAHGHY
jgi:hypothetical protein